MEGEEDVPKIKLGDASCAAPFTSKLSHVSASEYRVVWLLDVGLTSFVSSLAYYQAGQVYSGCDHSDVQDLGFELLDHRLESQCPVSRWDQVWRLPDYG